MSIAEIRRVRFGDIVRPGSETPDGVPRREALYGYLVPIDGGFVLLDTGIGLVDAETEAHYRPARVPIERALGAVGAAPRDVRVVVNCHLHFDHCGGNAAFPGVPVVVQRREAAEAEPDPAWEVDIVDGDAELAPHCRVIATPGHTAGHQSLLVTGADGVVLLAGQTHDTASEFAADVLAAELGTPAGRPDPPAWLAPLLGAGLTRAAFAHDAAVWLA